jgi:hypothetical protein
VYDFLFWISISSTDRRVQEAVYVIRILVSLRSVDSVFLFAIDMEGFIKKLWGDLLLIFSAYWR